MPTAHLIHGCIGAGKTTFARRLEEELPAIRISHDEWMAHLCGDDPPVDQFPVFRQQVSTLIDKQWKRCVELGLDVVLDLGSSTTPRSPIVSPAPLPRRMGTATA